MSRKLGLDLSVIYLQEHRIIEPSLVLLIAT